MNAIIAGLLYFLSFPPYDFWYLIFPALYLFYYSLLSSKKPFLSGFVFGCVAYGVILLGIQSIGLEAWIPLTFLMGLMYGVFSKLFSYLNTKSGNNFYVLFAALAVFDLIRAYFPFGGFPWGFPSTVLLTGPIDSPLFFQVPLSFKNFGPTGSSLLLQSLPLVIALGVFSKNISKNYLKDYSIFLLIIFTIFISIYVVNDYQYTQLETSELNITIVQGNSPCPGAKNRCSNESSWIVGMIILLLLLPIILKLLSNERIPNSKQENISNQLGMQNKHWTRKEALNHWVFWAVIVPFLIPPIFSTAFFFNMVHLTEIKDWSLISFTALFPFYTSMSIFTTLSSGWILDKFGVEKILPFYLLPMSLGMLIFSFGNTYLHAMIGLAFLGMTQGLAMTIGGTFWPNYYGTKNLGSVRSLSTSTMVFGTSLGPAIVGMLLDFGHNYNSILLGMCILAMFASISLAITMKHAPKLLSNNIKKGA